VAVVGGGVIGLAVAWRAARRGLSVIVVERGQPGGGTSRVAAGMLAPITEADPAEQGLLGLGLRSAAAYPAFVEELTEASGHDPGYLACGALVAARDADEAEALTRELEMRRGLGLPVQRLRPTEARALEPALAPVLRLGLAVPDDHVIDPPRLTAALAEVLRRAGGELLASTAVTSVTVSQGRVAGIVLADGQAIDAPHVVVAAGAWSPELGGLDPDARVPIRPVKGQILFMHDPAGPGLLTRLLRMADGYIVPRGDGRYVLGATMEERGFDTTVTAGAMFSLLRDASELLPGVSELVIDELCAGLRPASPDSAPIIGPGAVPGLHWATGHYRNGILLAPITADVVLDGIVGEDGAPDWAAPFSPRRFAGVAVGA
jgi:glycine oxidase